MVQLCSNNRQNQAGITNEKSLPGTHAPLAAVAISADVVREGSIVAGVSLVALGALATALLPCSQHSASGSGLGGLGAWNALPVPLVDPLALGLGVGADGVGPGSVLARGVVVAAALATLATALHVISDRRPSEG